MGPLVLSLLAIVLTIAALILTVSFLFSTQSRNNAFSSFISFFCLTSLCLTAACYNAYAAHEYDDRFSNYEPSFCNIQNYTEINNVNDQFCESKIVVDYVRGESRCDNISMISGEWIDVRGRNEIPTNVDVVGQHRCGSDLKIGSTHACIIPPHKCDTAIEGWSNNPVCNTPAVDGSSRNCFIIPLTAFVIGIFVMMTCLLSTCTMMWSNDCLLDECWSTGVRWLTSYATILLYLIIWGLTCYCTLAIWKTDCTALLGWGLALVVHGAICMGVLLPYLLFQSFKMEFSVFVVFLVGVVLHLLMSYYSYEEIWARPEGQCLSGWMYDFVHFLWVLTLLFNLMFGIPPIMVMLWECILTLIESYAARIMRRKTALFNRVFDAHLNGQKRAVLGIMKRISPRRTIDANVWDLISKYSYEMETLVSKDSNMEVDELSDRLFVNNRYEIGLSKEQLLEVEFESQYRSLLEFNNLYDRLVMRVGKWTKLGSGLEEFDAKQRTRLRRSNRRARRAPDNSISLSSSASSASASSTVELGAAVAPSTSI